jgi:hypothetical protein
MNEEQVQRPGPRPPGAADEEIWLQEVLSSQAEAYSPDAERMRAAVRERIAARSPRRIGARAGAGPWGPRGFRLVGIPAGIVAAGVCTLVAIGIGVSATQGSSTPPRSTAQAGGPAAAPSGSTGPEASAHAAADATGSPLAAGLLGATAGKAASSPPAPPSSAAAGASPSASPGGGGGGGGGVVTAVGTQNTAADNSVWSEEDVAVTLAAPVASFQLTVKVSLSPSVSSTGDWTNGNPSLFNITVETRSDGLYYTWQLKQDQTLNPGSTTFAVQFNHGNGTHNASLDTYSATAVSDAAHGSASGTSSGAF